MAPQLLLADWDQFCRSRYCCHRGVERHHDVIAARSRMSLPGAPQIPWRPSPPLIPARWVRSSSPTLKDGPRVSFRMTRERSISWRPVPLRPKTKSDLDPWRPQRCVMHGEEARAAAVVLASKMSQRCRADPPSRGIVVLEVIATRDRTRTQRPGRPRGNSALYLDF